ncbi:MAG: hypothetical protein IT192_05725 [Microbacteriaceae bacterium]|nr:hypothetical protein [Microbacteriaceae bacterium]
MNSRSASIRLGLQKLFLGLLTAIAVIPLFQIATTQGSAASENDCESTYLARDGRELFTPNPQTVPPPLRGFSWDCVSRLNIGHEDRAGEPRTYIFAFLNSDIAAVVDLLRSFEQAGWINGPSITWADPGDGTNQGGTSMTAKDLASLDYQPKYVLAKFTDASTGQDNLVLTYTDGFVYKNDSDITVPSIILSLTSSRLYSSQGIADPSVLSSLRTIADAVPSPTQVAVVCSASVILMLVVGYPASLLNTVIGSRYEQFVAWGRKVLKPGSGKRKPGSDSTEGGATDAPAGAKAGTSWLVWPGFVLAAIVGGFVDPAFGPNFMSLRVLLTGFASFVLFNLLGWFVVTRVLKKIEPDARPYVKFRWGSLLILFITVLIARVLDFSPGVIFGLVSGLTFAIALSSTRKAIVVLVGSGYALLISLIGWVGYSLLSPMAIPGNAILTGITEFLSGVTLEGISTLPLALLPLAALDGAKLIKWKKWVWAIAYAIGLACFALVLFTIPDSFKTFTGDFLKWTLIFVGFAIVAVAAWAIDTAAKKRAKKRKHVQAAATS